MIFEGTWTESVYTTTDTISDMYDAFKESKIPVLHIPKIEYEDTGSTLSDDIYFTFDKITEHTYDDGEHQGTYYSYEPDVVLVGGTTASIETASAGNGAITIALS